MPASWRTGLAILCLILVTWLVYGRLCTARFVAWDDPQMIWQNPRLVPPSLAKTAEFWRRPDLHLYTPLPYTLWSALAAWPDQPPNQPLSAAWFHAANVLVHTVAGIFVFLLLKELLGGESGCVAAAFSGAMVFLIHPVQVETVAWAAEMNNLLCGVLCVAALWQYVKYAKGGRPRRHLIIATVLYALALLSKPTAVALPLIAAALDAGWVRRPWKAAAKPLALWAAMAVPIALIARAAQPAADIYAPPIWGRLLVAVDAIGFYIGKLFGPVHLTIDYERTPQWILAHPWAAWPGFAALLAAEILLLLGRRARWVRVPLIVFAAGLLPVLGLTPFDFQIYSTVADRYLYLPMLGIALLAGGILARIKRPLIPWTAAGIVLVLLAARSFDQAGVWSSTFTLAAQQLRFDPDSSTGHKILAHALAEENRLPEAEVQYRDAIEAIGREGKGGNGVVWFDYGNLLRRQGRYAQAISEYQQAIPRLSPRQQPMAYNNLGVALLQDGDAAAARQQLLNALRLQPDYADAQQNLKRVERQLNSAK